MTRRATIINNTRAENAHVLVLDAGNSLLNDANPAVATRGATSVQAMNLMGYDAATPGFLDISALTLDELRARIAQADFPFLSANASSAETGNLIAEPYTLIDMGDLTIGILGITEPGTTPEVVVGDPLQAAKRWVPELAQQADIIILLSHAGMDADTLIAKSVPGIDTVIGGAAHGLSLPTLAGDMVPIYVADYAYAGTAGTRLGIATLGFSEDGTLEDESWERVRLDPEIDGDPVLAKWLTSLAGQY